MNYFKTMLLLAGLTALFIGAGYLLGGWNGMMLALAFVTATNIFAWWKSDKVVLRMHKARPVTEREAPDLYRMVAGLAQRAELPMPAVYIIDSDQPNAFATGRNPENSAVAMTTGIIRTLTPEELAGVIAHELAHIRNRDTLIMTVSATIAGAVSMLSQFTLFFGGSRDRPLGGIGTLVLAIFAPLAAIVIQMTISRTREYAADRAGALIAGNPMWLASALEKIHRSKKMLPSAMRFPASAHLFIMNPLAGGGMDSLFSTHPNIGNRIEALKQLAREMAQSGSPGFTAPEAPSQSRNPWGEARRERRTANPWR